MSKLDQLLLQLKAELDGSRSEITARTTQLNALHSAHKDTTDALAETQASLLEARAAKVKAENDAKKLGQEAQQRAAQLIGAADAGAADTYAKAKEQADELLADADASIAKARSKLEQDKARLTGDIAALRSEHSALSAKIDQMKKQAREFAGG